MLSKNIFNHENYVRIMVGLAIFLLIDSIYIKSSFLGVIIIYCFFIVAILDLKVSLKNIKMFEESFKVKGRVYSIVFLFIIELRGVERLITEIISKRINCVLTFNCKMIYLILIFIIGVVTILNIKYIFINENEVRIRGSVFKKSEIKHIYVIQENSYYRLFFTFKTNGEIEVKLEEEEWVKFEKSDLGFHSRLIEKI